ncbi:hypothetical protein A2Z41_00665 [Microgenomates group bacterium RBG_19FT_COMBO_39_10]|nr:MAG: hypothetical protein A2Z41_00665 [Microgenomates group bacterium RBG_19FT_COMBO_39_10]
MKIKSLKRNGLFFHFINRKEFEILWRDIFQKEEYKIGLSNPKPLIFDVGAHIGLSTIYFKTKYPKAKIIAFEPNPQTAKLLRLNIKANHLKNVKIIEAAAYSQKGKALLYIDSATENPWTWGDSLIKNIWSSKNPPKTVSVRAVLLSKFLTKPIDLLKIDVEGAEFEIIKEASSKFHLIKNLIIEYHETPKTNPHNKLSLIAKILREIGFNINILKQNNEIVIKGVHES